MVQDAYVGDLWSCPLVAEEASMSSLSPDVL